jgi:ribosomal protein L16 Arg81 hydroxylase
MDILDKLNTYIEDEYYEDDELIESFLNFISLLDLDSLNEQQLETLDNVLDILEEDDILTERFERVVRGGKKVKRRVCRSGYKAKDGKCVTMKSSEKRRRSKGAKRGSRKKRSQKSSIERSRKRSLKRRT